jgi:hypothetical protein
MLESYVFIDERLIVSRAAEGTEEVVVADLV